MAPADRPILSVVVAIVSDTLSRPDVTHLEPCLSALTNQSGAPQMEVIVPYHPSVAGIVELRERFPEVRFLEVGDLRTYTGQSGTREHHNELRARGVAAARGEIVALIEDHGKADPHWCARMVEAHRAPVAAVGGAIENGAGGLLNWAVCFCDFGPYQNPVPEGDAAGASDANVSYKRAALESIRPVWREVFHEGAINHALKLRGERITLSPRAVVYQNRMNLSLRTALRERFVWGKSFGAGRRVTGVARLIWAALSVALPAVVLARHAAMAAHKGKLAPFLKSSPLLALLVMAWGLGESIAYITGARIENREPFASPPPEWPEAANARLSVVIVPLGDDAPRDDSSGLSAVLSALDNQTDRPAEVIVPYVPSTPIGGLRDAFPWVNFLPVTMDSPPESSERLDELRANGVSAATGDIIAIIEDHVRPDLNWAAEIRNAHRRAYAAVGGAIENGAVNVMSWAAYFTDLGRYHNPLPAGDSSYASVVNVSYKSAALKTVLAVWSRRFNETAVHAALLANNERIALSPAIVVTQHREDVRLGRSLRDFFTWGRSYGSTRVRLAGGARRLIYAMLSPVIPAVLLLRSGMDTARKGRLFTVWLKCLPVSTLLTVAWACGELTGYLAGEAHVPPKEVRARQQAAG